MPITKGDIVRWAGEGISVSALIGALLGLLPKLALLLTVLWTTIQIYESKTYKKVEKWLKDKWLQLMKKTG